MRLHTHGCKRQTNKIQMESKQIQTLNKQNTYGIQTGFGNQFSFIYVWIAFGCKQTEYKRLLNVLMQMESNRFMNVCLLCGSNSSSIIGSSSNGINISISSSINCCSRNCISSRSHRAPGKVATVMAAASAAAAAAATQTLGAWRRPITTLDYESSVVEAYRLGGHHMYPSCSYN